jgi:hypothetical protein
MERAEEEVAVVDFMVLFWIFTAQVEENHLVNIFYKK